MLTNAFGKTWVVRQKIQPKVPHSLDLRFVPVAQVCQVLIRLLGQRFLCRQSYEKLRMVCYYTVKTNIIIKTSFIVKTIQ